MDFVARLERLREKIVRERLGGLLITSLTNVRYLSGFSGSAAMLLVTSDSLVLFTDGRYRDQSAPEIAEARVEAETVIARTSEQFAAIGRATRSVDRLGLESGATSWELHGRLDDVTDPELVPTSGFVEQLRIVKDQGEIARIEKACEIADVAFAQTKERLVDSPSEREFAAELEYEMRRRGADGVAFESIVASGPNAAMPHAQPTDRPIAPGELVVVDFGARFDGYRSDMTRTVCVGDPVGEHAAVLDAVAASQRAGLLAVAPGVTGGAIDAACRGSLESAGYGDAFIHSTGHGVGLDVHEAPAVAKDSEDVIAENTVITVEPGVYLIDKVGARIEDTVVVTASGYRALTKTTKDPRNLMAISTNDLKNGMALDLPDGLFSVVEFQHVKPGKGGAFVRTKLRNLRTKAVVERTFRADERVEQALIDKREMQYLYRDGPDFVFMDNVSFEQTTVSAASLGEAASYLKTGDSAILELYGTEIVEVELPASVELEVAETEPGLQGDRVSGARKPATTETGLVVQVPLFVNPGDRIKVDTRSGEYLTRA